MARNDHRLGAGFTLPPELGMVRGVHRQPRFAGGAIITENGTLTTDDFVSGQDGWILRGDGTFELDGGIFRGDLESDNFVAGTSGWQLLEDGTAEFNGVTIRTDLESSNYVAGTSGWQLLNSGNAEFQDVIVRGTIKQGSEIDGEVNIVSGGNLQSDNYSAGTAGWSIDGDGNAEFNAITARGDIIADSFTTGVPNDRRIEIENGDVGQILFWEAGATTNPGFLQSVTTGSDVGVQLGAGSGNVLRITPTLGLSELYASADILLSAPIINIGQVGQSTIIDGALYRDVVTAAPWDELTWHAVSFQNSWVDFGGGFQAARYKMSGGQVEVQGWIKNGTVTAAAFTLPAGYRPAASLSFTSFEGTGALGRIDVTSAGAVIPQTGNNSAYLVQFSFTPG